MTHIALAQASRSVETKRVFDTMLNMNLIELGSVLGDFFEGGAGPSHDELDLAVGRAGLRTGDPGPGGRSQTGPVGKTKRVRQVLVYATDNDAGAGLALSRQLVDLLRADGMFEPSMERYAGEDKISRRS